ncbi:MAG: DUF362 domain-containing protein [Promethearchaeota archaeon]
MIKIGKTMVEESVNRETFIAIIKEMNLKPPVVIKPNWGFSVCFTEAMILDWVLSAVNSEALVVESYGWARTEEALKTGEWGSFKQDDLRKSDQWFLEYSGIGKVLKKHDVEFLNITEENWGNRTTDPDMIRDIVEKKYPPLERTEFYNFVPERLSELRGADLISLAKLRLLEEPMIVSFSVKNFFGMIPGPDRSRFHGKKHSLLNQSIVDIYKVYDSLFNIYGVVEAIFTASLRDPNTLEWETHENPGFVSASADPIELDAFVSSLLEINPDNIGYLKLAAKVFGGWSEESVTHGLDSGIKVLTT